jgi:hypothetical protein
MIRLKLIYIDEIIDNEEQLFAKESIIVQKKSLLKGGLRVLILDDPNKFKNCQWFENYKNGKNTEFYVDGSGKYRVVNIDLVEGEIYLEKANTSIYSKKIIFVDIPFSDEFKNAFIPKLKNRLVTSNITVDTIDNYTTGKGAIKLDDNIFREIYSCLLFIADITPICLKTINGNDKWIANSNVMIELGYALAVKPRNRILIVYNSSSINKNINVPFDIQSYRHITYSNENCDKLIAEVIEMLHQININI